MSDPTFSDLIKKTHELIGSGPPLKSVLKPINKAFDTVTSDYFPEVIFINSTFWDISRWNEDGKDLDKNGSPFYPILEQNVQNLTKHINKKALDALQR